MVSVPLLLRRDHRRGGLWGTEHLVFLTRFYRSDSGIPSHDALCDEFTALDPDVAGEVSTAANGRAQSAVEAFDGIGCADDPSHLRRESKERDHLVPLPPRRACGPCRET